ncbi:DNA-dependent ATPase protein rad54 [Tilletia horrida]|uniref:DNA-dependent ATPase protein rad54 n=1 Tax=Tilletia horrida TaxID=155126 RepID=A0AAN6JHU3_9BASI|nr:DNA-dependent ATPase protein rad54 [Tilletia horrida]
MRRSFVQAAHEAAIGGASSGVQEKTKGGPPPPSLPNDLVSRSATGGGFGPLLGRKPFKVPSRAGNSTSGAGADSMGGRRRKRVDYSGMGGGDENAQDGDAQLEDDGAEGTGASSKKRKGGASGKTLEGVYKGIDATGVSLNADRRVWKVFEADKTAIKRDFKMPVMRTNKGEVLEVQLRNAPLGTRRAVDIPPRPLHDPLGEHAIVLFDPTTDDREAEREKARLQSEQAQQEEKEVAQNGPHKSLADILGLKKAKSTIKPKVPVLVDPRLAKVLRPHQVEGVKFLYKCTTGLTVENAHGCIMADEMGLGKTLQCIALMFTLLKQSPIAGKSTIEKCIIVCPSSLVRNWANELVKWLGPAAPGTLALDGKLGKDDMLVAVRRWCEVSGRAVTQPVMIVSYETLRNLSEGLGGTEVGLLLCDEGHRLKNADSLTFTSLNQINVKRRVILSGTPIQNDLSEYFALLNFANPELLGTRTEFRKNFELDILRGRDAEATDGEQEKAKQKLQELSTLVSKFIIRRTNDLLSKYLPVKYEHVVFCKMAPFQLELYRHFIKSPEIKKLLKGTGSQPLKAIGILKKLCNHPDLLDLATDLEGSESCWPADYVPRDRRSVHSEYSGKMVVLERFLHQIRFNTKDKIVLISNYTQTLDVFERMCRINRWGHFRLDGTMTINKRQKLVDKFNDPEGGEFIFLLSSKAGGCGLNLIGANRLVLFDPDWNPAADQQALARVWRDGQKKSCFVYRFIATGSIEEKIFQRQSHKQSLSSCVVDEAQDAERHFSGEDLRALFQFKEDTVCDTHDTYKCKRCSGGKQRIKAQALLYGDTSTWNHYPHSELHHLHDDLLRAEKANDEVSFVFQYVTSN